MKTTLAKVLIALSAGLLGTDSSKRVPRKLFSGRSNNYSHYRSRGRKRTMTAAQQKREATKRRNKK